MFSSPGLVNVVGVHGGTSEEPQSEVTVKPFFGWLGACKGRGGDSEALAQRRVGGGASVLFIGATRMAGRGHGDVDAELEEARFGGGLVLGAVSASHGLASLDLSKCGITDGDAATLAALVRGGKLGQVTRFVLAGNALTDAGAVDLGQAALAARATHLDLSHNLLTDVAARAFAEMLGSPECSLVELNLAGNNVSGSGALSLALGCCAGGLTCRIGLDLASVEPLEPTAESVRDARTTESAAATSSLAVRKRRRLQDHLLPLRRRSAARLLAASQRKLRAWDEPNTTAALGLARDTEYLHPELAYEVERLESRARQSLRVLARAGLAPQPPRDQDALRFGTQRAQHDDVSANSPWSSDPYSDRDLLERLASFTWQGQPQELRGDGDSDSSSSDEDEVDDDGDDDDDDGEGEGGDDDAEGGTSESACAREPRAACPPHDAFEQALVEEIVAEAHEKPC